MFRKRKRLLAAGLVVNGQATPGAGIWFQCTLQRTSLSLPGRAHEGLYCLQLLQQWQKTVVCLHTESQCSKPPDFKPTAGLTTVWASWESTVHLNCTAVLSWDPNQEQCDSTLHWSRDGQPLTNVSLHMQNSSSWWFTHIFINADMLDFETEGKVFHSALSGLQFLVSWWLTVCWQLLSGRRRILGCTAAQWGMCRPTSAYKTRVRERHRFWYCV